LKIINLRDVAMIVQYDDVIYKEEKQDMCVLTKKETIDIWYELEFYDNQCLKEMTILENKWLF
jgi:hypothetical protein